MRFQRNTLLNRFALSSICILMHDGNYRRHLGKYYTITCNNKNIANLMVLNAQDINLHTSFVDYADIFTSNASICTSISKQVIWGIVMLRSNG